MGAGGLRAMLAPALDRFHNLWSLDTAAFGPPRAAGDGLLLLLGALALVVLGAGLVASLRIVMRLERGPSDT